MSSYDDSTSEVDEYEYESGSEFDYENNYISSEVDEINIPFASLYNQEPVSCSICCTDKVEEGLALSLPSCHHTFCVECFLGWVNAQIGQGNADSITCPFILEEDGKIGHQCKAPVDEDTLREIMDSSTFDKLVHKKEAAFVRKHVNYHHCPRPDCTNIVFCPYIDPEGGKDNANASAELPRIADCFKCGMSCLSCGAFPFHTGISCEKHREREEQAEKAAGVDRSRANEETKYEFGEVGIPNSDSQKNYKICRRCGNGIELQSGCLKMKCICGYRFCYECGSENAQCSCTPSFHGFTDNRTGGGDFSGLREQKSYT